LIGLDDFFNGRTADDIGISFAVVMGQTDIEGSGRRQ
jgi:hypothetical protein